MFKMYGRFMIGCPHRPAICFRKYAFFTQVDHRLNRQHNTFFQFWSAASFTIIRYLRIFMQASAQAMAYQFPYYPISMFLLGMFLYGKCNIAYTVTCNRFFNSFV